MNKLWDLFFGVVVFVSSVFVFAYALLGGL